MSRLVRLSSALALSALFATGCAAEMAPDGQTLDGQDPAAPAASAAPAPAEDPSADPAGEEPVAQSSEALSSCATTLVCSGSHQLTVYENSDCSGGKMYFCPGDYSDLTKITTNLGWFANWNDRISIMSTSKVAVWAYQHVNFGGDVRYFAPGTWTNLGGGLWNDKISSIKVRATN